MPRLLGMTYQQATWVSVGLQLLAVEIVAGLRGDSLLTDAMRLGSDRWMLWPAMLGTFCGHFFGTKGGPRYGAFVLVAMGIAVLWRDLFVRDPVPRSTHLEVFLLFFGAAAWLWGSR